MVTGDHFCNSYYFLKNKRKKNNIKYRRYSLTLYYAMQSIIIINRSLSEVSSWRKINNICHEFVDVRKNHVIDSNTY